MNVLTDIKAGPFKYSPIGLLSLSRYVEGGVALMVVDPESEEPLLTASVNIDGSSLAVDEICIKDWSENEGCTEALVKAGAIEVTENFMPTGHVTAPVCKIIGPLKDWLNELPTHQEFIAKYG